MQIANARLQKGEYREFYTTKIPECDKFFGIRVLAKQLHVVIFCRFDEATTNLEQINKEEC